MSENLIPGFSLVPNSLVEDQQTIPGFTKAEPEKVPVPRQSNFVKADEKKKKAAVEETAPAPTTAKEVEKKVKDGDSQLKVGGSESQEDKLKKADTQFDKDFKYFDKDNISKIAQGSEIEEKLVKDLNEKFSKWGFTFEESGAGDYVTVKTTNPDNLQEQEFSVGSFMTGLPDIDGIEDLSAFVFNNRESLDVFLDEVPTFSKQDLYNEVKSSEELKKLSIEELEEEAEKNKSLTSFAAKYYASKGVSYDNWKRLEDEQEDNQEELNFIEDKLFSVREEVAPMSYDGMTTPMTNRYSVFNSDYKANKEEIEKYPDLFNEDGTLKLAENDVSALQQFLDDRNKKAAAVLSNPIFQEAEEGMKQMLSDVRTDAQKEVLDKTKLNEEEFKIKATEFEDKTKVTWQNRDSYFDEYNKEQKVIQDEINSITNDADLETYVAKTQEEADKLNKLIADSKSLYDAKINPILNILKDVDRIAIESKKLSRLANNTLLLINFNDMSSFRGEYEEGAVTGVMNEWKKGLSEGKINSEFLDLAFGITDMEDQDQLAQVAKNVALQKAYSQGILSTRVFERYQNAGSVAEQLELLGQNPLEIISSLFTSSMSQFIETGDAMFFPIVGGTTAAYTVAGSAGFVTGPGGVLTTGGAALAGLGTGMNLWSTYTGFALELGAAYSTVLTANGVDMTNAEKIKEALQDVDMMREAKSLGIKRGIPIALMNFMGGAVSKAMVNPLASPIRQVGQTVAIKAGIDPLFEGGGELLAQVSAGEEIKATEVLNEMLGGQMGNQSSIAISTTQNVLFNNQTKVAKSLMDLNNMVKGNYSVDQIRKFSNLLIKNGKITKVEADQLIKNAEINSQVNNALQNSNKSLIKKGTDKVLGSVNMGQEPVIKKRLADLYKEKNLFKDNKDFVSDVQAEIDAIVETNGLVNNPIELTSDFQTKMGKEISMVQKVMKNLGINKDLEIIDVDNINQSLQDNKELSSVLNEMLSRENEMRADAGLPALNNVQDYINEKFKNATNTITPKELGKQFSLFSGSNIIGQMKKDRNNENRTGEKGFRHETLHFILDQVMSDEEITKVASELESYLEVESQKQGGAISSNAFENIRRRLDGYRGKVERGEYTEADYSQEVFTTLSDAINDNELKFERQNKNFWLKIADDLKDFFKYKLGLSKQEIEAKDLNSAESAFEFIKNYNKAFLGQNKFARLKGKNKKGSKNLRSSERLTVLEEINNLIPEDIVTKEDYRNFVNDPRKFNPLFYETFDFAEAKEFGLPIKKDGVISNYVKSRSIGGEYPGAIQSVRDRLPNFNPEEKRKDGRVVGVQGFGEFIFANTNFSKMDSRKNLAKQAEKRRSTQSIDSEEARQIASDDSPATKTEDKKDRVTPKSKIKKASPEFVTQEFENEIEVAALEILETVAANEISIEDGVFKDFVKEVLEGKLTDKTKKRLGLGNNYDFLIKKLVPKLKDILPISYFVKIESQTPVNERKFTKPPVRLTKQEDIDKARRDDKVYLENDKQGVNLYEFKNFTNKSLQDYLLPPLKIVSKKTGKEVRSGLKGNRKTTNASTFAVELGYDMMVALGNEKNLPNQSLMASKLQRKPNMRFSEMENTILDSDLSFEDYIQDKSMWRKLAKEMGFTSYNYNNEQDRINFKKNEMPKLVKILPKEFFLKSKGTFYATPKGKTKKVGDKKVKTGERIRLLPFDSATELTAWLNEFEASEEFNGYGKPFIDSEGKPMDKKTMEIGLARVGQTGSATTKFNNDFGTNEFVEQVKTKELILKQFFERTQDGGKNIQQAVLGVLQGTSAHQSHFIRTICPITFRQLNMVGKTVEEHALGASLLAKWGMLLAKDGLVNDNFTGITKNFVQGPIEKTNDNKVNRKELGMKTGPKKEDLYQTLIGDYDWVVRYASVSDFNLNTIEMLDNNYNKVMLTDQYNVSVEDKYKNLPNVIAKQNSLIVQQIKNGLSPKMAEKMINEYVNNLADTQQEAGKFTSNEVSRSNVMRASVDMTMEELLSKAITLDEALRKSNSLNQPIKKIRVFDFDDTLATSKNIVKATSPEGKTIDLNAEEFAKRGLELKEQGWNMDFSDFNNVTDGGRGPLFNVAQTIKDKKGNEDLYVLTARAPEARDAIYDFLKAEGLEFKRENIVGLGNSTGEAKANWLVNKAAEGYNDFYFADDAIQNVRAVKQVMGVVDVKSKVQQARMKSSEDLSIDFNKLIEETSGIEFYKEYSAAKAKTIGASKGRFKFFIPHSAEDFLGLIYPTLTKGKLGDAQMAWYKKHLIDPYTKAQENLSAARLNLMNDFKTLKKSLKVPKNLRKKNSTGMTNEQAVRVFLFTSMGYDVPGLSKSDLNELNEVVAKDPQLLTFAEQILTITKGDGYATPKAEWLTGTITTDLIDLINTEKRAKYLAEWQQNADAIYSTENLNKLEAIYGTKYRESLEGILKRMKSGRNRLDTGNRLSNQVLDYINGSIGTIMFFNTRSAVLQTISSINFVNWSFNNPIKAGKAFANQKQYWSDFSMLMNSDYLKDRRNGLKLNINESEIADAASTSKNKAKAVINYILQKGYLPTQYADSFAIASGGATFYRNRVNDLVKNEGFIQSEAESKALIEWRQVAEESQQSSDPSRISAQQSSNLGRVVLAFANTPMQYARIQKRAIQDLVNGRGDTKTHVSKIIYYGFLQNVIFNALQQAVFALGFGDDDEDDDKLSKSKQKKYFNTANGMLDSLLRGLGIAGQAVSVGKNFLLDVYERSNRKRPEYVDSVWKLTQFSPPVNSKISKLKQAAWHFDSKKRREKIFEKGFALDNPAYEALAKVVSATTNIPIDRLFYKMKNIEGALNEDNDMWQRIAMLAGWPEWQLKNPKDKVEATPEQIEKAKASKAVQAYKSAKGSTDYDTIKKLTSAQQIKMLKSLGYGEYTIKNAKSEKAKIDLIIYKNKGGKIKVDKKAVDTAKYKSLSKADQLRKLDSLGLSKSEIAKLKYEKDRVAKLLELMEN